jgi:hypothetical protein
MTFSTTLKSKRHHLDCYCADCETQILKDFACGKCGFDTLNNHEYYMLKDEIWLIANDGSSKGMLCIGCVEETLGRTLTKNDFTTAPVNGYTFFSLKSPRLADRLLS